MARRRYRAVRKRDRKGGDVWGVAAFEPRPGKPWRQVDWKTIGRGEPGEAEARALATEMERQQAEHGDSSGRPQPGGNLTPRVPEARNRVLGVARSLYRAQVGITQPTSGSPE